MKLKEGSDRIITFADGVDASTSGYFHNWSFAFGDQLIVYLDGTEETRAGAGATNGERYAE